MELLVQLLPQVRGESLKSYLACIHQQIFLQGFVQLPQRIGSDQPSAVLLQK